MNKLMNPVLCVFSIALVLSGCAEEEAAPPVLSAMNELDDLQDGAEDRAAEARRAAIMAAAPQGTEFPGIEPLVPQKGEFVVEFETTVGSFTVSVNRAWAPIGADRFYQLVKDGFYDDSGFFRVVPNFMVQFGLAANSAMTSKWKHPIQDDPVIESNQRGYITFAKTNDPNSRTGQVFINFKNNSRLDGMGFAPFGKVIKGMDVVDSINSEHGESPQQGLIEAQGNSYLKTSFPGLDFIKTARVIVDDQVASVDTEKPGASDNSEANTADPSPSEPR